MKVFVAREELLRCALGCLSAERAEESANKDAQQQWADEQLAVAAKALVGAVDEGPKHNQPIGWCA